MALASPSFSSLAGRDAHLAYFKNIGGVGLDVCSKSSKRNSIQYIKLLNIFYVCVFKSGNPCELFHAITQSVSVFEVSPGGVLSPSIILKSALISQ